MAAQSLFELCTCRTHGAPDAERDKQTNKKKQTPHFRTYRRRALFDLPQSLHDGRARRLAHHKTSYSFFNVIHSFSAMGQNVDFWLLSKKNTGRLPLRVILPVKTYKHHVFAPTAGARCTIFPKLCMLMELLVPIKKAHQFFDPTHSFSYSARKNSA